MRSHLFTRQARAHVDSCKVRLSVARTECRLAEERRAVAEAELQEAEYNLTLQFEADDLAAERAKA